MHAFTIDTITCNAVSTKAGNFERFNIDDLILDVRLDSPPREPYSPRPVLEAGESWDIDETFPFDSDVLLHFDRFPKPGFKSKRLTNKNKYVHGQDRLNDTLRFREVNNGAADYTVEYTVEPNKFSNPPKDTVEHAIRKFKNSPLSGDWLRLDDSRIKTWVEHLAKRPIDNRSLPSTYDQQNDDVNDVFEVQQDGVGHCGPASIEFNMAYLQPRRFVEACRAIFEQGHLIGSDHVLRSSVELRRSPSPTLREDKSSWLDKICGSGNSEAKKYTIPEADWMFMTLLEDTDDWYEWKDEKKSRFRDIVRDDVIKGITAEDLQEGAKSNSRRFWIREVLGYQDARTKWAEGRWIDDPDPESEKQYEVFDGEPCLQAAAQSVSNGGIGLLDIDTQLIVEDDPSEISEEPNDLNYSHAVSMFQPQTGSVLDKADGKYTFKVHSCGRIYEVDAFPAAKVKKLIQKVHLGGTS